MKITVFTGNQPRHLSLINDLSQVADEVYAVQECTTVFPGRIADFYQKSAVMQEYFTHVLAAEKTIFGDIGFLNQKNVQRLMIKEGDLNLVDLKILTPALAADVFIVFGSSYIKSPLVDRLVERRAINIHMGISPYYRGSSCNFWALADQRVDCVGATIHMLTKGLDSGAMLFHALPKACKVNPFEFGMLAVNAAHKGLMHYLKKGTLLDLPLVDQDKAKQVRYTRNADFTDDVARRYLDHALTAEGLLALAEKRSADHLLNPFYI